MVHLKCGGGHAGSKARVQMRKCIPKDHIVVWPVLDFLIELPLCPLGAKVVKGRSQGLSPLQCLLDAQAKWSWNSQHKLHQRSIALQSSVQRERVFISVHRTCWTFWTGRSIVQDLDPLQATLHEGLESSRLAPLKLAAAVCKASSIYVYWMGPKM